MKDQFNPRARTRSLLNPALREDETMLPGGATAAIDDLEERGVMSDALSRKARPEVYAAEHGGMSPGQVDVMERGLRRPPESDDFLASRPAPMGPREDEVELPGGGQASFDELESTGSLTPALIAKARPDVSRAMGDEVGTARERMRSMLSATQPRVNERQRDIREDAMMRRIISEERPGISQADISRHMAEYRRDPERFGRTFYPLAARERETMAVAEAAARRAQALSDTERRVREDEIRTALRRGR